MQQDRKKFHEPFDRGLLAGRPIAAGRHPIFSCRLTCGPPASQRLGSPRWFLPPSPIPGCRRGHHRPRDAARVGERQMLALWSWERKHPDGGARQLDRLRRRNIDLFEVLERFREKCRRSGNIQQTGTSREVAVQRLPASEMNPGPPCSFEVTRRCNSGFAICHERATDCEIRRTTAREYS